MRVAIFICLLAGGAMALPSHIAEREVAEIETRNPAMELIIMGLLEAFRLTIDDPIRESEVTLDLNELLEVNGMLHLKELVVTGVRQFQVHDLSVSGIFNQQLDCTLGISELQANADEYDLAVVHNGITVYGNGPAFVEITGARIHLTSNVGLAISGITISECNLEIAIDTFKSRIENIIGGEAESDFINSVLAYLVPVLLDFFKPQISVFACDLITDLVNNS